MNVCVHEMNGKFETIQLVTIRVSKDIEVITSPGEGLATLFYNELEIEFTFNPQTAKIVNKMIGARPRAQILYMQLLRNYEITT